MRKYITALILLLMITSGLSACKDYGGFTDIPEIKLFYCKPEEGMINNPCIYDVKTEESEILAVEGCEDVYFYDTCGYSDGEFFAYYETDDECKILKVKDGKTVATHDFEAEFEAPENWEFSDRSILSIARYKDGVVVLSPSVDSYCDEPFYAEIPSTLYYVDFSGSCEPIIENVVTYKVYKDKICYSSFDEIRLVEYGETSIYSKFNINIYENGETREVIPSEECSYSSVEDWCNENELLLMKDGNIVKYNIEKQEETLMLKPKFYYSFEEGKTRYVSDKYILACTMKQNIFTLNSDVSYLYLFDAESDRRIMVSENLTGTYDAPFEVINRQGMLS